MATASGNEIFARARVIATGMGMDPSQSPVIDSLGALRALMNNTIRDVWRQKSGSQNFIRDITVRHTVAVLSGTGDCPDAIMREFLRQSQFEDDNGSLISYMLYNIDQNSGVLYDQLGYVTIQDDSFKYRAPSPDLDAYSGNLFVTAPSFPDLPASMADSISFPSESIIDDLCYQLALAIRGDVKLRIV